MIAVTNVPASSAWYQQLLDARSGHGGEEYEQIVLEQLWSPPQILQMRRNWCRDETRPFHISGTFRDRRFTVEDVCIEQPLPFPDDGMFDRSVFPDFLRYQKNLMKECPQRCIH